MVLLISTFDENVSLPSKFETYRSPGTYFSCNPQGVPVTLDMTRFSIPEWWFRQMKLDLPQQGYALNKVSKIVFGTSPDSPRDVESQVEIGELALHGRDERYLAWLAGVILASWSAFGLWFFRTHSRALIASLDSKMKKDLTLVAYRQLTLEPYKDKEKAAVLRFIATNYTNPELDLEGVAAGTGANRNKINDVLKTELGMTFTSYLNKLRLTEAARLLAEKSDAPVAQIAYAVGYANVSYFNKLFKEEYGCTPKAFRSLATAQEKPAGCRAPELSGSPADAGA
ncbi:helix-turn-helix domain-containing protein [Massilia pseudoviolaceinigra]|uniref:helix-turn-helix domain-containing protein n=1 Tax=Massilia pseudoviolaceinigra TaxID=3057165 RepID=UPI002796985E|nr:helix-turn-helix domain-containing protein [Massilia sp. CCM 9206]MDQ1919200.1 helix-turn-helix domain-containing protein [Massilia sp. CCM 9206]